MPELHGVPSGWGRGGRAAAAPEEFHLSRSLTSRGRSSPLGECHRRRRARGRRSPRLEGWREELGYCDAHGPWVVE